MRVSAANAIRLAPAFMLALLAGNAAAQTTTTVAQPTTTSVQPTTTTTLACPRTDPLTCEGTKKLYVTWVAKDPQKLRVSFSATRCPQIPGCGTKPDATLLSQPPVALKIIDADGRSFGLTVADPGVNIDGCPSGKDDYRGAGRLRFVFGAADSGVSTTVMGKQRIPQAQATAPSLTPPIQVLVSDACGPLYTYTVNTCYPRVGDFQTYLKCF